MTRRRTRKQKRGGGVMFLTKRVIVVDKIVHDGLAKLIKCGKGKR